MVPTFAAPHAGSVKFTTGLAGIAFTVMSNVLVEVPQAPVNDTVYVFKAWVRVGVPLMVKSPAVPSQLELTPAGNAGLILGVTPVKVPET